MNAPEREPGGDAVIDEADFANHPLLSRLEASSDMDGDLAMGIFGLTDDMARHVAAMIKMRHSHTSAWSEWQSGYVTWFPSRNQPAPAWHFPFDWDRFAEPSQPVRWQAMVENQD